MPDGSLRSRFVYGDDNDVPAYMERGGRTYRLLTDDLGSVRQVIDAQSGGVAQEIDYDPYGRVVRDTNPGFQPFGYAAGLYDADTGLVRFGARDYDPETGRFTTKDPLGFDGGDTSLYGYVLGDPVNLVDPEGTGPLGDVFGPGGFIDDIVPDPVSNAAAGFIDGYTWGEASHAFGIRGWCDAPGYGVGDFLSRIGWRGLIKHGVKDGIRAFAKKKKAKKPARHGPGKAPTGEKRPARDRRRERDRGPGSKGGRGDYRKPPPGHKGPWPPKD